MKKFSKKGIMGIIIGAVVVVAAVALILIMTLKVSTGEAREIALKESGGGEIVSEEVSSEGLWNEYGFVIENGEKWYKIEIGGFGNISEIESGTGQYID